MHSIIVVGLINHIKRLKNHTSMLLLKIKNKKARNIIYSNFSKQYWIKAQLQFLERRLVKILKFLLVEISLSKWILMLKMYKFMRMT